MKTILIVDDSKLNRKTMIGILNHNIEDLIFIEAKDGVEAMEALYEKEIDLMILDLNMPNKNGFEVLREMRKDEKFSNFPVVVNSSISEIEKVKEALSLGAIDFFIKGKRSDEMEIVIYTKIKNILAFFEHVNELTELRNNVKRDLSVATLIQQDLIKMRKEFKDIETYVHFEPLKELSGDMFSSITHGENKWVMLLDMKLGNVSMALTSLLIREIFMIYSKESKTASELARKINDIFIDNFADNESIFFSAMIVLIKDNKLSIVNAGHSTVPFIFRKEGIEKINNVGRMIGFMKDTKYEETICDYNKDDILVISTDGIYGNTHSFEKEKIEKNLNELYNDLKDMDISSKRMGLEVYSKFFDVKNGLSDDLTLACLKKIK